MTTQKTQVQPEPVYINTGRGRFFSYIAADIISTSPTGIKTVKYRPSGSVERFTPDGRKRGDHYGDRIDTVMGFAARTAWLKRQSQIQTAGLLVKRVQANNYTFEDVGGLTAEIDRLQALLDEARAAVAKIDAPEAA